MCLCGFCTRLYPIGDVNGYTTPQRASTKATLNVDSRSFHFFFALRIFFFCDIQLFYMYIVIGLPLSGNFQPEKNGRGLIHIHKVNSIMSERKAVIKNADMGEEMQQDAVDCATQALEKFNIEKVNVLKDCTFLIKSEASIATKNDKQTIPCSKGVSHLSVKAVFLRSSNHTIGIRQACLFV